MMNSFIDLGTTYKANVKLFFLNVSLKTAIQRDNQRGTLLGKTDTQKYHEKSLASKHSSEIEIDVENQEPSMVTEFILQNI